MAMDETRGINIADVAAKLETISCLRFSRFLRSFSRSFRLKILPRMMRISKSELLPMASLSASRRSIILSSPLRIYCCSISTERRASLIVSGTTSI